VVGDPFEVPRDQKVAHHKLVVRMHFRQLIQIREVKRIHLCLSACYYALAESIVEKTKDIASIEKEAVVSSQKIDVEDAPHLRLIIESIRRTAEYASDIAEVVLNLTIESILK